MTRVFVTGCAGEIGGALVTALLREEAVELVAGLDVRAPREMPGGLQFMRADVAEPFAELLRGLRIDTVIHAAYTVEPTHHDCHAAHTAVEGTRNVLDSARRAGVERLLHLSSATVYGAHAGNPALLREDAPLRPNAGFGYARDKVAAEAVLRSASGEFGAMLVLRPSFVVGPGTANALVRYLSWPVVPLPKTQAELQFVHRDDLVRIVLALLRRGVSGVFNVGASGGLTAEAMVRCLHGRPLRVSDGLLRAAQAAAWRLRSPLAPAPATALDLLRYSWCVDSAALEKVVPHAYRYTSAEAFREFAEARLLAGRRRLRQAR